MDMTVWLDDWQLECCGDSIRVGTEVTWTLTAPDQEWLAEMLGDTSIRLDGAEEHHSPERTDASATGTVASINAVHCRYAPRPGDPRPGHSYLVPGSGILTPLTYADGRSRARDDGRRLAGYVVRLANASRTVTVE